MALRTSSPNHQKSKPRRTALLRGSRTASFTPGLTGRVPFNIPSFPVQPDDSEVAS
jgi:hypothetical protein